MHLNSFSFNLQATTFQLNINCIELKISLRYTIEFKNIIHSNVAELGKFLEHKLKLFNFLALDTFATCIKSSLQLCQAKTSCHRICQ